MKKFIYIVLCSLFLVSCSNTDETKDNIKMLRNVETSTLNNSVELGLTHQSGFSSNQLVHYIEAGEDYEPTIFIKNGYPEHYLFRLFILLDYKQHSIEKNISYEDIELSPNESVSFSIDIKKLSKGLHDFIVLLVRDPDNILDEPKYINPEIVYYSRRVSLVVGDSNSAPETKYESIQGASIAKDLYSSTPFLTSNIEDNYFGLLKTINTNGLSKNLYLHYTVNDPKAKSIAIFCLLGKNQVEVMFPYVSIQKPGDIVVPLDLEKVRSSEDIPKNLIVGVARNPYVMQENVFDSDVLFTNLVTITK